MAVASGIDGDSCHAGTVVSSFALHGGRWRNLFSFSPLALHTAQHNRPITPIHPASHMHNYKVYIIVCGLICYILYYERSARVVMRYVGETTAVHSPQHTARGAHGQFAKGRLNVVCWEAKQQQQQQTANADCFSSTWIRLRLNSIGGRLNSLRADAINIQYTLEKV